MIVKGWMLEKANRLAKALFGAEADVRVTDSQAWVRKPDRHTAVAAKTVEVLVAELEKQTGERPVVTSQMVTVKQMGKLTGMHPSTISQDCFKGLIPGAFRDNKRWYVPKSAAEKLAERHPNGGRKVRAYRARRASPNGATEPALFTSPKLSFYGEDDAKVYEGVKAFVARYGDIFGITVKGFIARACANELKRLREKGL